MKKKSDKEGLCSYFGGCHCGKIKFTVWATASPEILDCNCSICSLTGFLHLIIPARQFILKSKKSALKKYRFGTKTAGHLFCKTCGIKSFYVPRSHPDGISVNARCLKSLDLKKCKIRKFKGKNWEAARKKL